MTEDDFENSTILENNSQSPDNKMRTPSDANKKEIKEPSPSSVISSSAVGSHTVVVEVVPGKKDRDRINNLEQKEKRLADVGVTRRKTYQIIADAMEAVVITEYRDAQGNVKYKETADFDKRKWAVEKALIMFGDAIERKEVEYGVSDSTLEKFKALSVAQLKARAADLILGKPVSRLSSEEGA